jgi:transposase InsO family protein
MGHILHGCARTTAAVRRDIQESKESIAVLAKRYNINPKTVVKWRSRKQEGVLDHKQGPREKFNTKLTALDETIIIQFRQKTRLSLDDCLDSLKETIPYLTRSSLHRCFVRHGLPQLPKDDLSQEEKKQFKSYPIGYVHVDITEINFAKEEKYYLFVGICRVSKYAYAQLYTRQTIENSLDFLDNLVEALPFRIHTILTDNGSQFINVMRSKKEGSLPKRHCFYTKCKEYGIRHRHTKPYTPKTNGQVERFNRTLKEATLKKYHYDNKDIMEKHINDFIIVYNCAKKLSAIKRMTPAQFCIKSYQENPKAFRKNPYHQIVGLNS